MGFTSSYASNFDIRRENKLRIEGIMLFSYTEKMNKAKTLEEKRRIVLEFDSMYGKGYFFDIVKKDKWYCTSRNQALFSLSASYAFKGARKGLFLQTSY